MKHSNADYCDIQLVENDSKLVISISDNGTTEGAIVMGHGLTHISNRSEAFGGKFEITKNAQGVKSHIELPV